MDVHPRAAAVGGYVGDKYLPQRFPNGDFAWFWKTWVSVCAKGGTASSPWSECRSNNPPAQH